MVSNQGASSTGVEKASIFRADAFLPSAQLLLFLLENTSLKPTVQGWEARLLGGLLPPQHSLTYVIIYTDTLTQLRAHRKGTGKMSPGPHHTHLRRDGRSPSSLHPHVRLPETTQNALLLYHPHHTFCLLNLINSDVKYVSGDVQRVLCNFFENM